MVAKNAQDTFNNAVVLKTVWEFLGVTPPPSALATTDLFDAREYLHKSGLPFKSVTLFAQAFHVNVNSEMPGILGIPTRTFTRRKTKGTLDFNESVTVFIAAELFHEAVGVFGNAAAAVEWFREPNSAIREKRPLDLISDDLGRKLVEDLLGRIRHGIYE